MILSSTYKKVQMFFVNEGHSKVILRFMGIGVKEYDALKTISSPKKKLAHNWYVNNVVFPITFSLLVPSLLSGIHTWFGTISYDKSFTDIVLSGSFTLSGLNILRSASTMVAERLDDSKLSDPIKILWLQVREDVAIIKNKLDLALNYLTYAGIISYLLQVSQIIRGTNSVIYVFIIVFCFIFLVSVLIGRLVFVFNANFLSNEDVVKLLYTNISGQSYDNSSLTDKVKQGGL